MNARSGSMAARGNRPPRQRGEWGQYPITKKGSEPNGTKLRIQAVKSVGYDACTRQPADESEDFHEVFLDSACRCSIL